MKIPRLLFTLFLSFVMFATAYPCSAAPQVRIKISTPQGSATAIMEDNAAAKALVGKMPFTVPMQNLYERELCYRMGHGALPKGGERDDSYAVGDIIYWPPAGSLVILYKQNGELFDRQQLGRIEGNDIDIFARSRGADITFERID